MKLFLTQIVIWACFIGRCYGQSANLDIYRCPPCGNEACDTILFKRPGVCPICHMNLVRQALERKAGTGVAGHGFEGHWEGVAKTTDQRLNFSLDIMSTPLGILFNSADLKAMKVAARNIKAANDSLSFELTGDHSTTVFSLAIVNGSLAGALTTSDENVSGENRTAKFVLKKTSPPPVKYIIREVAWSNGMVSLSGSLYIPKGAGRFPAIVSNHSSGDQLRYDGAFMADYLASRGIAVLTYDKRGDGKSTGDWRTSNFDDLAGDCIGGIEYLKTVHQIDPNLIGIFGHSQGGTISPIIVSKCRGIAFNIAAAAFAVSPEEQDIYRVTNTLKLAAHLDSTSIDSAIRFFKIWLEVAKTGTGWDELEKATLLAASAKWYPWVEPPPKNNWIWKWYRIAGNYDYTIYWQKVHIPTLLIYGEYDEVTPVEASIKEIKKDLRIAHNNRSTVVVIPNARHYFTRIGKEGDLWTQNASGYFEAIYDWIKHIRSEQY
ncbi:MAG: alpha/beta fold hydrolase [Bacteroidota bacterium]|nr:alpha/beta fold hydrolase [Bacteroidota bacterium]